MGKPILERLRRPSYWYADQLPHWAIATVICAAISGPLAHLTSLSQVASALIGMGVSIAAGFAWELRQNWGDKHETGDVEDSNFDLLFWTLGAFTGTLAVIGA